MTPWSVDVGPFGKCKTFGLHVCAYQRAICHVIEMDCENYEIRVLLRFLWKKSLSAAAAAREICEVEGQGTVSTRTARNRYLLSLFGLYE